MADTTVQIKETPVIDRVDPEEINSNNGAKAAVVETSVAENGLSQSSPDDSDNTVILKQNQTNDEAAPASKNVADVGMLDEEKTDVAESVNTNVETPAVLEENGGNKAVSTNRITEAKNGDTTDTTPAEAVKRKLPSETVDSAEAKANVTPEKKSKLVESAKEDVQNGSEATEVAA